MAKKTSCPITRAQFTEKAPSIKVTINGRDYTLEKKEFSTGSLGWYLNDKLPVEIDGKQVQVQIGLNLTVVGSKDLPVEAAPTPPPAPAPARADAEDITED